MYAYIWLYISLTPKIPPEFEYTRYLFFNLTITRGLIDVTSKRSMHDKCGAAAQNEKKRQDGHDLNFEAILLHFYPSFNDKEKRLREGHCPN